MNVRTAITALLMTATLPAAAQDGALDELIARARKRDAAAEYALGMRAYEGRGVPRDAGQAFRLVERAAKRGHLEAQNALGFFLQHGVGTAADPVRAREWYETAAARDHARAQVNLGWMHEHGLGTERAGAIALEWYRKAAAQGLAEGEFNAANLLETGAPADLAAAAAAYERAAKKEFVPAHYRLGRLLERGLVPAAEYGGALARYRSAARAGLPEAQFAAARLLLDGGGTANAREALEWLQKAAQQEYAPARALLADAASQYRIAQQLAADPAVAAQALPWLRRAAEQDHRPAQLQLGISLAEGLGFEADPAEAASWYAKAAAAGNAEALYRLALLYDDGVGVPRDTVKARDLLGQAVGLGHARAQERLTRLLGPTLPQLDGGDLFKGLR
jgi:hypothetical protein